MRDLSSITNYDAIKAEGDYHYEPCVRFNPNYPTTTPYYIAYTNQLFSVKTSSVMFDSEPAIGRCIAQQIDIEMLDGFGKLTIPKMCEMTLCARIVSNKTGLASGWIQKGVFFIDTRQKDVNKYGDDVLRITGYDSMLKSETDFVQQSENMEYYTAVTTIANTMGLPGVDFRTMAFFKSLPPEQQYKTPAPLGFTCREALSNIGAAYGGNWIITDENKLRLIRFADKIPETNYLLAEDDYLIIGKTSANGEEVRILV